MRCLVRMGSITTRYLFLFLIICEMPCILEKYDAEFSGFPYQRFLLLDSLPAKSDHRAKLTLWSNLYLGESERKKLDRKRNSAFYFW